MKRYQYYAIFSAILFGACAGEKPPTEPEGGLSLFTTALAAGDEAAIWDRLSPDTQLVCESALAALAATDQQIERLQPSDQADARAATGSELATTLESPLALFELLTDTAILPDLDEKERHRTGMRAESVVQVAEDTTIVVTRADQEFEMVRGEDGEWFVREPIYSLLSQATTRIHENRQRVEDAVRLFGVSAELEDELRAYGLLDG
ncbi:MAG: hypothetical protein ACJAYU_005211 [Bradymonadia bacterium]